jgi:predicted ArsR family transcriptional regulator
MDPIDEQIIITLRNSKTMRFEELLSKLGVSHNTLRLHIDAMAARASQVHPMRSQQVPKRLSTLVLA